MHKTKGFTLLETIIAVTILGVIASYATYLILDNYQKGQGNILATQTLTYSKIFAKYVNDLQSNNVYIMTSGNNCVQVNNIPVGSTKIISLQDLNQPFGQLVNKLNPLLMQCTPTQNSYIPSSLTNSNLFSQSPCLGITRTTDGNLQSFMYWVNTNKSASVPLFVSQLAALKLGGAGGYLDSSGVLHTAGGWSLNPNDARFANPGTCGGVSIGANTVIMNMQQFIEANSTLSDSLAIYRESDGVYPMGDIRNKNTAKTDIFLSQGASNHNIILNKDANVSISTDNNQNTTINNANFIANTWRGTQQYSSGTLCSQAQVGQVAAQADPGAAVNGVQQSQVICSDSQLVCSIYGGRYCWIPVMDQSEEFKDSSNTGWIGTRFVCPAYAPFMQSASAYQSGNPNLQITNIVSRYGNYTLVRGATVAGLTPGTGCTYHYSVDMCSGHASGDYQCTTSPGSSPPPAISFAGYNGGICGGSTHQYIPGWGGCPWGQAYQTSIACTTIGPAMINDAMCTSKVILQGS